MGVPSGRSPLLDVQPLIDYGMLPELLGRFPHRIRLQPLGRHDLLEILTRPEIGLLDRYRRMLASQGMEIGWDGAAAERIALEAERLGLGARGLRTIIEREAADLLYAHPQDLKDAVALRAGV